MPSWSCRRAAGRARARARRRAQAPQSPRAQRRHSRQFPPYGTCSGCRRCWRGGSFRSRATEPWPSQMAAMCSCSAASTPPARPSTACTDSIPPAEQPGSLERWRRRRMERERCCSASARSCSAAPARPCTTSSRNTTPPAAARAWSATSRRSAPTWPWRRSVDMSWSPPASTGLGHSTPSSPPRTSDTSGC